jgi:protease IV
MKEFFKYMFASMLGFILVLVVLFFVSVGIIASLLTFAEKETFVADPNSVLHITLTKEVYDRAPKDPFNIFSPMGFDMEQNPGLNEILKMINRAKTDNNIKGIFLDLSIVPSGLSIVREIRLALQDFKSSGKFIIAYGEVYAQGAYYLATVADKVYLHPSGAIDFRGLSANLFFLKGTLDKLDIKMQVIRHGKFKSAVEPFITDKMSDANREQMTTMVSGMWSTILDDISTSRNIDKARLNQLADNLDAFDPDKALAANMVDGLMYKDELMSALREKLGIASDAKIKTVSLSQYALAADPADEKAGTDRIAVIYAIGQIMDGKGDDLNIGSQRISEAIRKARENDKVKAIVIRVNSPGGSALASEVIHREVVLAKEKKPVIISMGDVAASGGYWISASATKILADPTTLTGSIGVFGLIPDMKGFFENKLGITFDQANTNKYSDFPNITRPMTDYEIVVMQRQIESIYSDFLKLVSEGRNIQISQVDSIGQGRVWNGLDAKRLGLIDGFGGLNDAIALAAETAGITDYYIWSLPAQKDTWQQLIDELTGSDNSTSARIRAELGEYYTYYQYLKEISESSGIQARLPYDIKVQ